MQDTDPEPTPERATHLDEIPSSPMVPLRLRAGYALQINEAQTEQGIQLIAPDGKICLDIRLTEKGPTLEIDAVSLSIRATQALSLDCQNLDIHARAGMNFSAGGDIELRAEGSLETIAKDQKISATRGDVMVEANDDVSLDGETIRLNSPKHRNHNARAAHAREARK